MRSQLGASDQLAGVNGRFSPRRLLTSICVLWISALFAQGSENAIAAAVTFAALAFGAVIGGLVITLLFLFQRRGWQRIAVLGLGMTLLATSLVIGGSRGGSSDMEFLTLLLGGAGVVCLSIGGILRPRRLRP